MSIEFPISPPVRDTEWSDTVTLPGLKNPSGCRKSGDAPLLITPQTIIATAQYELANGNGPARSQIYRKANRQKAQYKQQQEFDPAASQEYFARFW
jgi:hypothetical protein